LNNLNNNNKIPAPKIQAHLISTSFLLSITGEGGEARKLSFEGIYHGKEDDWVDSRKFSNRGLRDHSRRSRRDDISEGRRQEAGEALE
jgi:hypothetical protein